MFLLFADFLMVAILAYALYRFLSWGASLPRSSEMPLSIVPDFQAMAARAHEERKADQEGKPNDFRGGSWR